MNKAFKTKLLNNIAQFFFLNSALHTDNPSFKQLVVTLLWSFLIQSTRATFPLIKTVRNKVTEEMKKTLTRKKFII